MLNRIVALLAALTLLGSAAAPAPASSAQTERAVLAGGCFWGMEAVFESLRGVKNVVSGFSGGRALTAHYEVVSTGATGHAESVEITFDPAEISYAQLLAVYFTVAHDPTELNRQGPDDGTQYRSAIFTTNDEQKKVTEAYIAQLNAAKVYKKPIVTKAKKNRKTPSAVKSISLFIRITPVRDPGQEGGHRHPGELVPVEEGKTEQHRVVKIIKRDDEQTEQRQKQ